MEGVNSVSREQIRDIARYQQKAEKQEGGVQAKQAAAGEAASISYIFSIFSGISQARRTDASRWVRPKQKCWRHARPFGPMRPS